MEKVFIAGGAGFIGSHVCEYLKGHAKNIVVADNLLLGKEEHIQHLYSNNFSFVKSDLSVYSSTEAIFKKYEFDTVIHLAANSDIQASQNNPRRDIDNTLLTTVNILECMRRYKVKQILFSSSSAVYGYAPNIQIAEDQGLINPVSYYGAAKASSEALISAYSHMNNITAYIFRFPNVVGERLTHGVLYDFIAKLKKNPRRLEIMGNGQQTKPYLYVADLIEAMFLIRKKSRDPINCYNIGVNTRTPVNKIADMVCAAMGLSDVQYLYTGGKEGWKGDIPEFDYELSKISALGWKPRFESDEAIKYSLRKMLS